MFSAPVPHVVCPHCGGHTFEEIAETRAEKASGCLVWILSGWTSIIFYPLFKFAIDPMLRRFYVRCKVCRRLMARSAFWP